MNAYLIVANGWHGFGATSPDGDSSAWGFPTEVAARAWIEQQTARQMPRERERVLVMAD
jgi:hypothetical protein